MKQYPVGDKNPQSEARQTEKKAAALAGCEIENPSPGLKGSCYFFGAGPHRESVERTTFPARAHQIRPTPPPPSGNRGTDCIMCCPFGRTRN